MRNHLQLKRVPWCFWIMFVLGVCAFFPMMTYAQDLQPPSNNSVFFTPSSNDQSIIYLGELFGSIPPVLAGTGSGLMGKLFSIFNTTVMTLGILFAGYTTFVGILNTAGEGEMLGKGWSSIWVPIRTIAGIALLIPTASGYCVCQIFMMWLLIQGIGAADTLTSTVVDYLEQGQKVFVKGNTPTANSNPGPITTWDNTINTVYEGLTCMQSYQKDYPEVNAAYVTPPAPSLNSAGTIATYKFVVNKNTAEKGATPVSEKVYCGTLTIPPTTSNTLTTDATTIGFLTQGLNAIMPSLNSAAYFMVNDEPNPDTEDQGLQDTYDFVGSDFMNEVANTYNSYVIQADNHLDNEGTNGYGDLYEDIRSYGWASLGNIYWGMAQSEGVSSGDATRLAQLAWTPSTNGSPETYNIAQNTTSYSQTAQTYQPWATQFITDLEKARDDDNGGGTLEPAGSTTQSFMANGVISAMTLQVLTNMEHDLSGNTNPIVAAQKLGHNISYDVEAILTTLMIAATTTALVVGVYSSVNPYYLAYQTLIAMALPGLLVLAGMMLVMGGTLAVVIPLMPAIIYFMAVIAWLIATLETIVAAPIVAIGVIHPEGHAVWGKAEPAIMLMTNMFLRPSLMVIGMSAGVILSWITVQFVNFGYAEVMDSILNTKAGRQGVSSMEASLYLITYTAAILACVNKSFTVIDALPDTVMRWIQGGEATKFGGGQEASQKIQGTQESGGQKAGGDAMSSGHEAAGAGDKALDKADKGAERAKSGGSGNQINQKLGGSGTGGIKNPFKS